MKGTIEAQSLIELYSMPSDWIWLCLNIHFILSDDREHDRVSIFNITPKISNLTDMKVKLKLSLSFANLGEETHGSFTLTLIVL